MMHIAKSTLSRIEEALSSDQGAKWRGLLRECMAELEDAYRDKEESFRSHMGASKMGTQCSRDIWFSFHWASKPSFNGRMQRLFNRGHLEEGRFVALLRLIGVEVFQFDSNGKQFRISGSSGHYGGSGDGIGRFVPDVPEGEDCLLEFKTHNEKSFTKLTKEGVRSAKPEHYAQMVQYILKFNLKFGLYMAINKNNDELHAEIIVANNELGLQLAERADSIVWLRQPPAKIGNPPSAGNFACRWCDHRPVCHLKAEPDHNCRTCANSMPVESEDNSGAWFCERWGCNIPKDAQQAGCADWEKHSAFK